MFVIMYVIIIAVPRSSIILNCSFCLFALPAISSPNPWLWKLFCFLSLCFCIFYSVQFNRSVMFDSLRPHGLQHTSPPCPSPTPGVHSNSCPLSQWCYLTIPSSAIHFCFCLHSFPATGSFSMSHFFTSGVQSIAASASPSAFPMNIKGWFPLGLAGLISLLSKGLSRVSCHTTTQKAYSSAL